MTGELSSWISLCSIMHTSVTASLIWLYAFAALTCCQAANIKPNVNLESILIQDLMEGYNRHARPIADVTKPVEVFISFYLTKILGLDEKNQVLQTFGWLEVHWTDEFLRWNSSEYGGLERIIVPPELIWLPDFGLENSAEAIYDDQADKKFRAGVDFDGSIQWVPGGKFTTSCQLDITLYPFDQQVCEMDFVDWTYDGRFVMLINGSDKVGLDVYKKHGEWDLVHTQSIRLNQYFDSDPGVPFPTVKFVLHLRRKPKFYMINVVAPCILMSVLALLVFYLPPESGEKVSLGITVLLSFSVFLLLIAENVPKTSDCVPLIGIYLTMVMVTTGFSIITSVIVLNLHHHEHHASVPSWLRRIVYFFLARLLFFHIPPSFIRDVRTSKYTPTSSNNSFNNVPYRARSSGRYSNSIPEEDTEGDNHQSTPQEISLDGLNNHVIKGSSYYDEHLESLLGGKKSQRRAQLDEILQHLRDITSKMRKNIKKDHIKGEWKMVAKIIDRFLLVTNLFFIAMFSLFILYIYPIVIMHKHYDIQTTAGH